MNKSTFQKFIEKSRNLLVLDLLIGLPFLLFPLLVNLPYRVNIFLTWEGAYRISEGQVPFVDFGLPMGFGYWLIPTLFFKLFGPTFLSLVKAQVLINLISMVSLRGILYNLKIRPIVVSLSLLVFSLTYVIYNFWPWYNHSVIVFELVTLYFITSFNDSKTKTAYYAQLILAGVFTFVTFYTKQDVGGVCFLLCIFLIGQICLTERTIKPIFVYLLAFFTRARPHRGFSRTVHAQRGRGVGRTDREIWRDNADPGGVPGASEHRPGLRRADRARRKAHAWQDLHDRAYRPGRVQGSAVAVRSDALSFAGDRARQPAGLPGGHRLER